MSFFYPNWLRIPYFEYPTSIIYHSLEKVNVGITNITLIYLILKRVIFEQQDFLYFLGIFTSSSFLYIYLFFLPK